MITGQEEKKELAVVPRYRPQLRIDPKLQKAIDESIEHQEIEKYSITPTTFHSRSFFAEPAWYKDTFKHANQEVTRFGINAKFLSPKMISDEGIKLQVLEQSERSRITGSYKQEDAWELQHHSLEINLLQQAIDHLLDDRECRTVLVDIFERINDKVKIENSGLKIHTVVLYKNPINDEKHEVTVIDPSNFLFSSHLSKPDLGIAHPLLSKITTIHRSTQIYKAPSSKMVGPNKNQYRDCIDIAVKIAFGLSQHEWILIDSEKEVKKHPVIQNISNETELDKNIIVKTFPTRIKQASDIRTIDKFNKIQKTLKENLAMVYSKYLDLHNKLATSYKAAIIHNETYRDTLKGMVDFNKKILNELLENLDSEHTILVGEVYEDF